MAPVASQLSGSMTFAWPGCLEPGWLADDVIVTYHFASGWRFSTQSRVQKCPLLLPILTKTEMYTQNFAKLSSIKFH
jgi:hypothetical protein